MHEKTTDEIIFDEVSQIFKQHGLSPKDYEALIWAVINRFADYIAPELLEDIIRF